MSVYFVICNSNFGNRYMLYAAVLWLTHVRLKSGCTRFSTHNFLVNWLKLQLESLRMLWIIFYLGMQQNLFMIVTLFLVVPIYHSLPVNFLLTFFIALPSGQEAAGPQSGIEGTSSNGICKPLDNVRVYHVFFRSPSGTVPFWASFCCTLGDSGPWSVISIRITGMEARTNNQNNNTTLVRSG